MSTTIQNLQVSSRSMMSTNAPQYASSEWIPWKKRDKPEELMSALNEHQGVHDWAVNEFAKEWNDLPPLKMGGQQDDWKNQYQQRLNACFSKVKTSAATKWGLILLGGLSFLVFGFTGVVLLILGATFGWFIQCWLDDHYKIQEARLAAGYA